MFEGLLIYLNAGIFLLSLIVLGEVFVNFKRPFNLKICFLIFVSAIATNAFGVIYSKTNSYSLWLVDLPTPIIGIVLFVIMSILYHFKLKLETIFFSALIIIPSLILAFYIAPLVPEIFTFRKTNVSGSLKVVYITKAILGGMYFALLYPLVKKIREKYVSENIYFQKLRTWSSFLVLATPILWVLNFIRTYILAKTVWCYFLIAFIHLFMLLMILFRPRFLNRSSLKIKLGDFFNIKSDEGLTKEVFLNAFFNELYYLNKEASLENLSKQLNVPSETLYKFIYNNYNIGFNDLVNKHRVDYFIELINKQKFNNYTIDALAQLSGFTSRHHLYKPFKKFHGGTPSDFIRSVES